jgi:hypothetical protein
MKLRFKVVKVNHIEYPVTGRENCSFGSYTKSCVIRNQVTGEQYEIDRDSNPSGDDLKIINKVDNYDLCKGDEFDI